MLLIDQAEGEVGGHGRRRYRPSLCLGCDERPLVERWGHADRWATGSVNRLLEGHREVPSSQPGQAEFHVRGFVTLVPSNRLDADTSSWFGYDTNSPALNLLPDDLLGFGQVCGGFEFTPTGFVSWVNHRTVLSSDRWERPRSTEFAQHSSKTGIAAMRIHSVFKK